MKPKFGEPGFNCGEINPSYKGDLAGYDAIHIWVRRRKPMPELCEKCQATKPFDLANKTGQYLRDLKDWEYLCRHCHMESDGRNQKLIESGKSRKIPNRLCEHCDSSFHPVSKNSKFCTRACYMLAGGRYWNKKENRA